MCCVQLVQLLAFVVFLSEQTQEWKRYVTFPDVCIGVFSVMGCPPTAYCIGVHLALCVRVRVCVLVRVLVLVRVH